MSNIYLSFPEQSFHIVGLNPQHSITGFNGGIVSLDLEMKYIEISVPWSRKAIIMKSNQWGTTTAHVIRPTCHYDVVDFFHQFIFFHHYTIAFYSSV